MSQQNPMVGWGMAGCGALLALVTGGLGLFGAFHVFIDPRGAISDDEAAPFLGGCCCAMIGLALAGVGIFLALRANKANAAGDAAAAPGDAPPPPPAPPG